MKKTIYVLSAMAVFMVVFVSACGAAQPAAPTAVPIPTQAPPPAPPVEAPTQQQLPPTVQVFAPACPAVSCAAPDVQDTEALQGYCVKKIRYQNILIDPGVTFEVLNPATLTCVDNAAVADGKRVIECHGTPLWTTEVKLTNTACGATNLVVDPNQCQNGFGYDAAQGCCAPLSGAGNASVTIKVNMGDCP
jgi:hypothetical protein